VIAAFVFLIVLGSGAALLRLLTQWCRADARTFKAFENWFVGSVGTETEQRMAEALAADVLDEITKMVRVGMGGEEMALLILKTKHLLAALCERSQAEGVAPPVELAGVLETFPRWFLVLNEVNERRVNAGNGEVLPGLGEA